MNPVPQNGSRSAVPGPVRWARALLLVLALSHLLIPVALWLDSASLRATISAGHPGFGRAELDSSVQIALAGAAVFHLLVLAVCLFLAWKLGGGRPWTRRLATISQVLAVVFSIVSWSSSPMFHAVIPVLDLAAFVVVLLLWAPEPARAFFAGTVPLPRRSRGLA